MEEAVDAKLMAGSSYPNDSWLAGEALPAAFYPHDPVDPAPPPAATATPLPLPLPAPVHGTVPTAHSGFQDLIDRAHGPMAVCDRELRYLAVNWRWKKEFGLEGRNLVGQKHSELFPFLGTQWDRAVESALLGRPEECSRDQWVLPSNRPAWVRWHLEPWSTKRESIGGFTITCEILSSAPTGPQALIGKSLLLSSPHPVIRIDLEGRIADCNAPAQSWAGSSLPPGGRPLWWDVFCAPEQRETVGRRFLRDARESLERATFCFPAVWDRGYAPTRLGAAELVWAAHPCLDEGERLAGVLLTGIAGSKLPSPAAAPHSAAPFTGSSLAQLVELAPFGIVLLDAEGKTLFANHEHASLLGFDLRSHASLEDWLHSACPPGEDSAKLVQAWRTSVWHEEASRSFALRSSDHRVRHIRFQPRRTADGGMLLALSDVTEFQRQLEHLEDSEGLFRSLFFHAQAGLVLEDAATGKIVHANPASAVLTRRPPGELKGRRFLDVVHPEDRPAVQARVASIRRQAASPGASLDIRLQPARGDAAPPPDAAAPMVRLTLCGIPGGANGELLHVAYFLTDVAIERLRPGSTPPEDPAQTLQLRRQAMAFEQADDAILITDPSGRILEANPAADRLFGYPRENILGQSFSLLFAPRQPQPFHQAVAAAFAKTGTWSGPQTFVRRDGSEGRCQVRYVAAVAPSGRSTLIIGFHRPLGEVGAAEGGWEVREEKNERAEPHRR